MTPKEKAKELILKFAFKGAQHEGEAKTFALIAVDQMMLVLPFTDKHKSLNEYAIQMQKYLEQVINEIEKL